jgi:nucleotide-binding universal stress UspA family protein
MGAGGESLHAESLLNELLIGSVTQEVIRHADIPVTIVK